LCIPGKVMGGLLNFLKLRVRLCKCYRTHRSSGYCGPGVQNSQKFQEGARSVVPVPRVLWHRAYRTHRSYGYGYQSLTEVPGTGMGVVQNSRKFFVRVWMLYKIAEAPGNTRVNAGPQGRSSIWSGVFHPTCMACSHWANVPEAVFCCLGIIGNYHRDDESWTSTSGERGNSLAHG